MRKLCRIIEKMGSDFCVGSGCEVRSLWTWAHHRPALDESVRRASGLVQLTGFAPIFPMRLPTHQKQGQEELTDYPLTKKGGA